MDVAASRETIPVFEMRPDYEAAVDELERMLERFLPGGAAG